MNTTFDQAFLGDPALAPRWERVSCKGIVPASRRRYLEKAGGVALVSKVLSRVGPVAARWLDDPPPCGTWTAIGPLLEIDRALIEVVLDNDVAAFRYVTAEIAEFDVNALFHRLVQVVGQRWVMRGLPLVHSLVFRPGRARILTFDAAARRCVMDTDVVLPRYICTYGLTGWVHKSLEIAGARAPQIVHDACVHRGDATCRYAIRW